MRTFLIILCLFMVSNTSTVTSMTPPINVTVTIQDSGGITERDMSLDMLSEAAEYVRSGWLEFAKISYLQQGAPAEGFDGAAKAESYYVQSFGKKLGIINVTYYLKSTGQVLGRMVRVFGLVDGGIATIGCLGQSAEKIPVTFGACGDKIKEVFHIQN